MSNILLLVSSISGTVHLAPSVSWAAHPADFLKKSNIVFDTPKSVLWKDELHFVAEIPEGEANKYELRTASGQLFLDRVICPRKIAGGREIQAYPLSYGINPGRINVDGDPLDLVVAGNGQYYRDQAKAGRPEVRKVRVIGMMKMEECEEPPCEEGKWKQDWKILAVDPADKALSKVVNAADLPPESLKTFTEFFSNYKGQKNGAPMTRVTGFADKDETWKFIKKEFKPLDSRKREKEVADCQHLFAETYKNLKDMGTGQEVAKNDRYLTCLQRVHYKGFIPPEPSSKFFMEFNAAQRALELGDTRVTLANAISKHDERKKAKKTYYRFAAHDLPAPPGTGNPIYEWIKTRGKFEGCAANFPPQHYEANPIVNLK